jgi:hypothetical protein
VTGVAVVGGILVGLFIGWCVTMVVTLALISRSQERMQRKVRYWQAETARAQAEADRLASAGAAGTARTPPRKLPPIQLPPEPDHKPWTW